MKDQSNHLNLAREAVKLELNGRNFFQQAAEKTHNELGKKMFEKLSFDELKHLHDFKEIFSSLVSGENWDNLVRQEKSKAKSPVIEELLPRLAKGDSASELKAIRIGMELERKAIKFFTKILNEIKDPKIQEIVTKIREEEESHYDLLQAEYDFLTNAGYWFDVAEHRMDAKF